MVRRCCFAIKSVAYYQDFGTQEPQLDVEVVCVLKGLEASCGIWGGENPQVRVLQGVPTEPLCVARKGASESARRAAIM